MAWFEHLLIVASNDINEETIHSLNQQVCLAFLCYFHTATELLLFCRSWKCETPEWRRSERRWRHPF